MGGIKKILVLRFSAMGDVALLVPVLRSLAQAHPDAEVTLATRPRFAAFFTGIPRLKVFPADVDHTYRGITGLFRLYRQLTRSGAYDVVVDVHDHLRTKILRAFFRMTTKVVVFNKGRSEKKAFSRKRHKIVRPLTHTVERYRAAFTKAGVPFDLLPSPHLQPDDRAEASVMNWLATLKLDKTEPWIGIAPFARHATKIWSPDNYPLLMEKILARGPARFFFFGGGASEIAWFEQLQQVFREFSVLVAGQLDLPAEIALIKRLDLMVCVDSSNMHLAALAGTPIVSLWGGTHPAVGFAPWSDDARILQVDREALPCRPCSVYGRETCYVGGFPCLTRITPALVGDTVMEVLHRPSR